MKSIFGLVFIVLSTNNNLIANIYPTYVGKNFTAYVVANKNLSLTIAVTNEKSKKLKIILKDIDQKVFGQRINELFLEDTLDDFSKEYVKTIHLDNLQDVDYQLSVFCEKESFKYNFTISTRLQKADSYRVLE